MARLLGLFLNLQAIALCIMQAKSYLLNDDLLLPFASRPTDDFDAKNGSLLTPILISRVPGTQGSTRVLTHFVDFFRTNLPSWELSFQNSTSKTPVTGDRDVPFVNLIAAWRPPWTSFCQVKYLTLAAHYDSKASPHGFVGATDSAAPCAILLHVAQSIDTFLCKKWSSAESKASSPDSSKGDPVVGLQILFLDGEEMFGDWTGTETNVLYGSRSLAAEWERTECPPHSVNKNRLESIPLFVLLDLLGAKDAKIPSYFKTTHWAYARMAHLEARLRHQGLFKSCPECIGRHEADTNRNYKIRQKMLSDVTKGRNSAESTWFLESEKNESDSWVERRIIDDHLPFIDRDVEVLHIIPEPFPSVWHTVNDNGKHLDINTVGDWASLITAFGAEWMVSQGFIDYDEG